MPSHTFPVLNEWLLIGDFTGHTKAGCCRDVAGSHLVALLRLFFDIQDIQSSKAPLESQG